VRLEDVLTGALLLWALAIAACDWRWRKVPNLLLLALLGPALAILCWRGAGLLQAPVAASLIGLVAGFGLTLPGYVTSKLGAGDVKLSAVIGFVLGWPLAGSFLLISALMLGAMAFAVVSLLGMQNAREVRIPAAVALSGGFVAVLAAVRGGWL